MLLEHRYIAVVGARQVHPWVIEWLDHELLPVLKERPIGIVSGGARGVDQQAHRLAIRAGAPTIVVVPSGLNYKYPSDLRSFQRFKNVGFLSEYEPDSLMRKYYFHRRNQLIAALAPLCLVVQASEKSGTMITAQQAIHMGQWVAALPGLPIDSFMSGNNQLLFDGALIVRNKNDLLSIIDRIYTN
jgi:DNA processing protein